MLDVCLDALIDSAKLFGVAFVMYVILALFENKIARRLSHENKFSPLIGACFGLVPQCGLTVVGADLYHKRHITMGTLLALFIACSDEAMPILLSSGKKAIMVIPLLISKFVIAFIAGYIVDAIFRKKKSDVTNHSEHCEHDVDKDIHTGCCHHHIENDDEEGKLHKYLVHPLVHSLKIFGYVLIINFIFNTIIFYVGKESFNNFLLSNKYLAPLFAVLVGLIPNCASSVVITEVYLLGGISFGTCLGGLIVNAGLGFVFLFRNGKDIKENLTILGILTLVGIICGYVTSFILGF